MTLHRWADIKDRKLRMPQTVPRKRRRWPDGWYFSSREVVCEGVPVTRGQRRRFWSAVLLFHKHLARSRR